MTPATSPRKRQLPEEEWDFSELRSAKTRLQFAASCWEYQREALRLIQHPEIPSPWLCIEESKRPIPSGADAPPFRERVEADASLAAPAPATLDEAIEAAAATGRKAAKQKLIDLPQTGAFLTTHKIEINWIHSDKEILAELEKWVLAQREPGNRDQRGRPDRYMAELWDLAIYRLRVVEKLSRGKTITRLQGAKAYPRNRNYEPAQAQDQEFSRARGKALKRIKSVADIFRKSPIFKQLAGHGHFFWMRGAAMNAMSWIDGPD
jgi:hypothetical protein